MSRLNDAIDMLAQKTGGSITTIDVLTNLLSDGGAVALEMIHAHKDPMVAGVAASAPVASAWTSLWQYQGTSPHGAVPTSWANPTNTTQGAIGQANPGGGRTKYNLSAVGGAPTAGMLVIGDRLGHMGGLDSTVTTAQNTNGGSAGTITRNTGGIGNMLLVEIYTQIGATATTITASYTNDQGTAGQASLAAVFGGTGAREAQRLIPLPLAVGDFGVQAVTSATVLATTGTAGNFGITIFRPLVYIPVASNGAWVVKNFINGNVPQFDTNACLAMVFVPTTTTPLNVDVILKSVEN